MTGRLHDKIAIVMGAGASAPGWGIGKATAAAFAREGARVFAVDLRLEAAEETRAAIEGEGGRCVAHAADALDEASVAAAVAACGAAFGPVDILFNNVGGGIGGDPVEMSVADWRANVDLNLTPPFIAAKCVLPVMRRQRRGSIVNVASIAGIRDLPDSGVSYQAAKAGVLQLSRSIAARSAADGIRSNCILPGYIDTPEITRRLVAKYGENRAREVHDMRAAKCPDGTLGTGWDIAWTAVFLASDEARYVNGAEIVVDGGVTLRTSSGGYGTGAQPG